MKPRNIPRTYETNLVSLTYVPLQARLLVVCWLLKVPATGYRVYLRDGSAQTIVRAATLRQTLSVYCDWVRWKVLFAASISVWQHVQLSE